MAESASEYVSSASQAQVHSLGSGSGAGRAEPRDNNVRDDENLWRIGAEANVGAARKELTAAPVTMHDGEVAALRVTHDTHRMHCSGDCG